MVSEAIDKLKRKMSDDGVDGDSQEYAEPVVYLMVRPLTTLFRVESFKQMSQ